MRTYLSAGYSDICVGGARCRRPAGHSQTSGGREAILRPATVLRSDRQRPRVHLRQQMLLRHRGWAERGSDDLIPHEHGSGACMSSTGDRQGRPFCSGGGLQRPEGCEPGRPEAEVPLWMEQHAFRQAQTVHELLESGRLWTIARPFSGAQSAARHCAVPSAQRHRPAVLAPWQEDCCPPALTLRSPINTHRHEHLQMARTRRQAVLPQSLPCPALAAQKH